MASLRDRLARLQGRITPPGFPAKLPGMDLLLKLTDHRRRELDHADRRAEAEGRGRLAEADPPDELVLTLDEKREMLRNAEWFVREYIPGQRRLDQGQAARAALDELERRSRENVTRLRDEIGLMETMEGSKQ